MNSTKKALIALWRNEEGLTMVEYAVAGGLIAAAGVVAFQTLGLNVEAVINNLATIIGAETGG